MKSKAKRMLAILLALLLAMPAMASAEGDVRWSSRLS